MSRRAFLARRAARRDRRTDGNGVVLDHCASCGQHRVVIEDTRTCADCVSEATVARYAVRSAPAAPSVVLVPQAFAR